MPGPIRYLLLAFLLTGAAVMLNAQQRKATYSSTFCGVPLMPADTPGLFICRLHETPPEYPGGTAALRAFLKEHIPLPDSLEEFEARILVKFIVDTTGAVDSIRLVRRVHPVLDSLTLRALHKLSPWRPATMDGKKVKASYTLPITIRPD